MENNMIPQLRFPEFEGEWNSDKLGSIATFSKGKGISKSDINKDGALECIRYGELYTVYSEVITEIVSKTNLDKDELVLSEENDVIIPASGETQIDIATASCVIKSGIALGGDLNIIKSDIDGIFLSYYLNNARKKNIARLAQGISVVHLYSSQLASLTVNIPTPPEQTCIANFLTAVDKRINLLQKKKAELEQYKKGVMQGIFVSNYDANDDYENYDKKNQSQSKNQNNHSLRLRFKQDDGNDFPDWEEKKLGEVAEKRSSNISANSLSESNGDFKIYGATGYLQNVDFYREEKQYISIVKDGAGVGRTLLCVAKSSVLGTLDIIKPKNENNLEFLYSLINQIHFDKYITGSTIPHIYFKDYSKENVNIPVPEEQQKIANFLSSIDKLINNLQLKIDNSQLFKQGLLQKMFV